MPNTPTNKDAMDNWLKQKRQASNQRPQRPVRRPANNVGLEKVRKLKHELKESRMQNAQLRKQRDQKRDHKQQVQEDKGLHSLTHGFNEVFDKKYKRTRVDPKTNKDIHYTVHVRLKPLTMTDQFAVDSEDERLTNTIGRFFERNEYILLHAFTTMRVEGQKDGCIVPKSFQNTDSVVDTGFLIQVYYEFLDWERNFCRYQQTE